MIKVCCTCCSVHSSLFFSSSFYYSLRRWKEYWIDADEEAEHVRRYLLSLIIDVHQKHVMSIRMVWRSFESGQLSRPVPLSVAGSLTSDSAWRAPADDGGHFVGRGAVARAAVRSVATPLRRRQPAGRALSGRSADERPRFRKYQHLKWVKSLQNMKLEIAPSSKDTVE